MLHVKQGLSSHVHLVQDSSMEVILVIPTLNVEKRMTTILDLLLRCLTLMVWYMWFSFSL
jgi:hypothetical protein